MRRYSRRELLKTSLAAGAGVAAVVLPAGRARIRPAAHADVPGAEVDVWLQAHPRVAAAMIWEFPPPATIPRIVFSFWPVLWLAPGIDPDPLLIPPLSTSVLPDVARVVTGPETLDQTSSLAASLTTEAGLAQPLAAGDPGRAPSLMSSQVPPGLWQGLPGGVKKSEYGAEIRSWSKWPDWAKAELRMRFAVARDWAQIACPLYQEYASSGFSTKPAGFDDVFSHAVDLDPVPVTDPPVNLQPDDPAVSGVPWAMVTSHDAFALYVRLVAAQLAIEITGCVPWSLANETDADLAVLLDGRRIFRYVPAGPSEWGEMTATGHVVSTTVTPAPPLVVLGFLAQNGLIGTDRTETVLRLLEWERTHLRHVVGGGAPAVPLGSGVLYWGYNGRAPVSRMINGTVMAAPLEGPNYFFFDPEIRHWVGGCGGASGFNEQVLRLVNIAAEKTVHGHFQNRFSLDNGVHAGIGHADDPYGLASAPEIPIHEILIEDATFHSWFVDEADPAVVLKNVSRRSADLYLQYLPEVLLDLHCKDILWFNNDHASSLVYGWAFMATYTVQEMETKGLWTGIEAQLAALGGCAALGF